MRKDGVYMLVGCWRYEEAVINAADISRSIYTFLEFGAGAITTTMIQFR